MSDFNINPIVIDDLPLVDEASAETVNNNNDNVNGTLINIILDSSGSMYCRQQETITGFNKYVDELREEENTFLTVVTFSDDVKKVYTAKAIKKVPILDNQSYSPSGQTALYEAIGQTISSVEKKLKSKKNKFSNILFVIFTDGQNNIIREHTQEGINKLVSNKTEEGWTLTYMGANQNAESVAQTMGILRSNAKSYSTDNMSEAMAYLGGTTKKYMCSVKSNLDDKSYTKTFFDDDIDLVKETDYRKYLTKK